MFNNYKRNFKKYFETIYLQNNIQNIFNYVFTVLKKISYKPLKFNLVSVHCSTHRNFKLKLDVIWFYT